MPNGNDLGLDTKSLSCFLLAFHSSLQTRKFCKSQEMGIGLDSEKNREREWLNLVGFLRVYGFCDYQSRAYVDNIGGGGNPTRGAGTKHDFSRQGQSINERPSLILIGSSLKPGGHGPAAPWFRPCRESGGFSWVEDREREREKVRA